MHWRGKWKVEFTVFSLLAVEAFHKVLSSDVLKWSCPDEGSSGHSPLFWAFQPGKASRVVVEVMRKRVEAAESCRVKPTIGTRAIFSQKLFQQGYPSFLGVAQRGWYWDQLRGCPQLSRVGTAWMGWCQLRGCPSYPDSSLAGRKCELRG